MMKIINACVLQTLNYIDSFTVCGHFNVLYSPLITIYMYLSESLPVDVEKAGLPVTRRKPKSVGGCNFIILDHVVALYTLYFI